MIKTVLITLSTAAILTMSGCAGSSAAMTTQMVDFKGTPVKLSGNLVSVGDDAPTATVVTKSLKEKVVGGKSEKTQILVIVPSVDTPTCDLETRTFNEKVSEIKNADLTIISVDTPFALKRFCAAKGIDNITVASDFRYHEIAKKYGVLVDSGLIKGVLARSIFVIKDGKVVYKQLVGEISAEPDYDAVLKAI